MGVYKVIKIKFPFRNRKKGAPSHRKQFHFQNTYRKLYRKIKTAAVFTPIYQWNMHHKRNINPKVKKRIAIGAIALLAIIAVFKAPAILQRGQEIFIRDTMPFVIPEGEYAPVPQPLPQTNSNGTAEGITYETLQNLKTPQEVISQMLAIEEGADIRQEDIFMDKLYPGSLTINLTAPSPKVLIFHTHSQENFSDSRPDVKEDTIVGIGQTLGEILSARYGVMVVHDLGEYDVSQGKLDRGNSYETMEPAIRTVLEKYPTIEVLIDLHRDGVPADVHLVTEVNGKPTAKLMLVNGVCRQTGNTISDPARQNEYIQENLALSLQMQAMGNSLYPGLMRKTYIKPYRYSLHMKPLSVLVEVGADTNSVQEAKNAMEPLARIITAVLGKK